MIDIEVTLHSEEEENKQVYLRMIDEDVVQLTFNEDNNIVVEMSLNLQELKLALYKLST